MININLDQGGFFFEVFDSKTEAITFLKLKLEIEVQILFILLCFGLWRISFTVDLQSNVSKAKGFQDPL
jgi:hypothetical protein